MNLAAIENAIRHCTAAVLLCGNTLCKQYLKKESQVKKTTIEFSNDFILLFFLC
jgi:hypothetical protein